MTDYMAPAAYALRCVHIRDPAAAPTVDPQRLGQDTAGRTICGLPLRHDELWQFLDLREGDRVCAQCADPSLNGRAATQEALL